MTPQQFIEKWRAAQLKERSAAQEHFIDLCHLLHHPTPAEHDPKGEHFAFERGAEKRDGGNGWADVWKRGFFGWEYKGKRKDLDAAYEQLLLYREALDNPPILAVCDLERFVIRTNFTGYPTKKLEFSLDGLADARNLEALKAVFFEPERLRPDKSCEAITIDAAGKLADVAQALRKRDNEPHAVARFLDRIVFCLFAEDVGLLPSQLFRKVTEKADRNPGRFAKLLRQLFDVMAIGGDFGMDEIKHFNGSLFTGGETLELRSDEMDVILAAAKLDWAEVDPSIFGTLFERGMDPGKRSQLGAHYTSRTDIETLIEPVIMAPLKREWDAAKTAVENVLTLGKADPNAKGKAIAPAKRPAAARKLAKDFHERLTEIRVLDPACGSGNFLYVALQRLKDLEKEVLLFLADRLDENILPQIGPWNLAGIEKNPYAFDLAQLTAWIGYLQWTKKNGYGFERKPILESLPNFHNMDAILDLSDPKHPKEPVWPDAEFIVGNPPFLGNRFLNAELGDIYGKKLGEMYYNRLQGKPDLCCYWFEKAREQISQKRCRRAGLLATQGIRGQGNREVLNRIARSGSIYFAVSDLNWILDGAAVHISMIGFDDGSEDSRILDGNRVASVNADLTSSADLTKARRLIANDTCSFQGAIKRGSFDLDEAEAFQLLKLSGNPNGRPNSDVIVPFMNGLDVTRRNRRMWIVDYGERNDCFRAAEYDGPFSYVLKVVKPEREKANQAKARENWWLHWCARPQMNEAIELLERFLVVPRVAKHRIFEWLAPPLYVDCQLIAFAFDDDYHFGVLHSRIHEVWALAQGTQVREKESGFRYTPTTCFETFPFPRPTAAQREEIAAAAKELDTRRNNWLNPPEWTKTEVLEFPGSVDGPWRRYVHDPDARGIGTVKYPRLVPRDVDYAKMLAKRTLTNLYNQRPAWLDLAHKRLDAGVFAAYGWPVDLTNDDLLAKLLALNLERAAEEAKQG